MYIQGNEILQLFHVGCCMLRVLSISGSGMVIALSVDFMLKYRLSDLIEIWCRVIIYLVVLTDYLIIIIFFP